MTANLLVGEQPSPTQRRSSTTFQFHIVVFSFNRAMQCDSVLRSIREHVKTPNLKVSVVWHATDAHQDGYALLRKLHEKDGVRFYERDGRIRFLTQVLPRLWMPRNLYHWIKYDYVRKADNFKPLLEKVIADTPADFLSFNTDDTVYYRDEHLPQQAFRELARSPFHCSYRVYVGANVVGCPSLKCESAELLSWDYRDPTLSNHWAYPFAVEGTFYSQSAVLSVIRRILYHNPVTLEAYVNSYTRSNGLFWRGYSPVHSTMVGLLLNKVSYIVPHNAHGNLSVDRLNTLFLDQYRLEYELPSPQVYSRLTPERVLAVRGTERMSLSLTAHGRCA